MLLELELVLPSERLAPASASARAFRWASLATDAAEGTRGRLRKCSRCSTGGEFRRSVHFFLARCVLPLLLLVLL